jgi:type II secretory pathway component PulF
VTREPAEPLSDDEASRPPGTWAADDGTIPEDIGTWEAADESPESASLPEAKGKDAVGEYDADVEARLVPRSEPWRVSHLMIAVGVVALILWFCVTLRTLALVLLPMGLLVLAITAGFVTARLRASRQEALLSLLAIAAERGVPLAPAIAAFADQFRGRAQRRILDVAAQLQAGEPLPEALEWPFRAASRDALLMVRIGEATGRLAAALRMVGGGRTARVAAWSSIVSRLSYILVLLIVAQSICGFLLYFIVPKFEAIFSDFGVPLPSLTIYLIEASHYVVQAGPFTFALYLGQLVLLIFLPFSYGGWMNYQVPVFDRLFARRHAALVLRALSLVIEADKPIGLGLEILAKRYPALWLRRRLARVAKDVEKGADWIEALWKAGVIRRADAEVLGSAASVGNLAWACRELADTAERRQQLRGQLLVQALFPLAILAIGLAVATLCVAYFIPLVVLIERLAG